MKLYEVPRNSYIRIVDPHAEVPVGAFGLNAGEVIKFGHIDGMYSYCKSLEGNTVHLKAWTEVEIVDTSSDQSSKGK